MFTNVYVGKQGKSYRHPASHCVCYRTGNRASDGLVGADWVKQKSRISRDTTTNSASKNLLH